MGKDRDGYPPKERRPTEKMSMTAKKKGQNGIPRKRDLASAKGEKKQRFIFPKGTKQGN